MSHFERVSDLPKKLMIYSVNKRVKVVRNIVPNKLRWCGFGKEARQEVLSQT